MTDRNKHDQPRHLDDFNPDERGRVRAFFKAGPSRDPELERVVKQAAGKIDPGGWRETNAVFIKLPHNPYLMLVGDLVILLSGVYWFFGLEFRAPLVAIIGGGFFVLVALMVGIFTIRRIPAWHRARKAAAEFIAEHGGKMPIELRTWG